MAMNRLALRPGPLIMGAMVALAVMVALYLAFREPTYGVDIGTVATGPMTVTMDDEGETRVHDLYVIAAPINGRVERIELEAGDMVTAGMIVARMTQGEPDFLDSRTESRTRAQIAALDAVAASAAARVDQARSQYVLARKERERVAALFEQGFATRAALDRADSATEQAQARLSEAGRAATAARMDREAARAALTRPGAADRGKPLVIRSPVNGTVMRRARESEGMIAAGTSLVEIGDPEKLEIVTDLLSSDAVRVAPGARVGIDNWGGQGLLEGRVNRVEPFGFTKISALGVEEQRVNVIIDFAGPLKFRARLGHGYRVRVHIHEWESPQVRQVPVSALFRDRGGWAVFMVERGRAKMRSVDAGHMNDDKAEILDGLSDGDRVILHPGEKIADGVRVFVQ